MTTNMQQALMEDKLLQVTKVVEKQIDATIEDLDHLSVSDLEQLRKSRLQELKKKQEQEREWRRNGHGCYEELPEEKSFFDVIKKSDNVVLHFYTNSSMRCQIVDKHLKILAPKHVETRFTKLNAEKCPFLAERLKIKTIPTIVLIQKGAMIDKIVGFTQLGNRDDFTTEALEWRIAQNGVINYEGDLSTPPDMQEKKRVHGSKKIRSAEYSTDDDDLDIEEYALCKESLLQSAGDAKSGHLSTELTAEEAAELGLDD